MSCSRRTNNLMNLVRERAAFSIMITNKSSQFQRLKIIKRRLFIDVNDMKKGESFLHLNRNNYRANFLQQRLNNGLV